ncbi:unnamed protein product [Brassica oleracea var. botrytis]
MAYVFNSIYSIGHDEYTIHGDMDNSKVLFSGVKFGKCSFVVEARLMRFWEARNVKLGGELMWVDMLMVNSTIIQATIRANRLPTFCRRLTAGAIDSISDSGKPETLKVVASRWV